MRFFQHLLPLQNFFSLKLRKFTSVNLVFIWFNPTDTDDPAGTFLHIILSTKKQVGFCVYF